MCIRDRSAHCPRRRGVGPDGEDLQKNGCRRERQRTDRPGKHEGVDLLGHRAGVGEGLVELQSRAMAYFVREARQAITLVSAWVRVSTSQPIHRSRAASANTGSARPIRPISLSPCARTRSRTRNRNRRPYPSIPGWTSARHPPPQQFLEASVITDRNEGGGNGSDIDSAAPGELVEKQSFVARQRLPGPGPTRRQPLRVTRGSRLWPH